MAISVFTKTGAKSTATVKLDRLVFGVRPKNHELLHRAYVAYLSNGRENLAVTKTRGEVSGGGRKPWRQKGTGRARVGSSRTPIWRGGGVTFGPTGRENYRKGLNIAMKRQAIRQALSLAADEEKIRIIERLECKDGKVATISKLLARLGVGEGRVLIVLEDKDALVERATRNLRQVKVVQARYINVFEVLNSDAIVISQPSLDFLGRWLRPADRAKISPGSQGVKE